MPDSCIIIGAGIAGLTLALSLSRRGVQCAVYEARESPATNGGSIVLMPYGARLLQALDVTLPGLALESFDVISLRTGGKLGEFNVRANDCAFRRVMRTDLHSALLNAVKKAGVPIHFGAKCASVRESDETVTVSFASGESATADFLVGCDGIHSVVRKSYVQPGREPTYFGKIVSYGTVPVSKLTKPLPFKSSQIGYGTQGSLVTSFVNPAKDTVIFASTTEHKEAQSREGWKTFGGDHKKMTSELQRGFDDSALPHVSDIVANTDDTFLWPIYELPKEGHWSRGRVLLIGDAAHAMPPQGEGVSMAIEDAVLFARIYAECPDVSVGERMRIFEKTRWPAIEAAHRTTETLQGRNVNRTWWQQVKMEWSIWVWLWWTWNQLPKRMQSDVRSIKIIR